MVINKTLKEWVSGKRIRASHIQLLGMKWWHNTFKYISRGYIILIHACTGLRSHYSCYNSQINNFTQLVHSCFCRPCTLPPCHPATPHFLYSQISVSKTTKIHCSVNKYHSSPLIVKMLYLIYTHLIIHSIQNIQFKCIIFFSRPLVNLTVDYNEQYCGYKTSLCTGWMIVNKLKLYSLQHAAYSNSLIYNACTASIQHLSGNAWQIHWQKPLHLLLTVSIPYEDQVCRLLSTEG